MPRQRGRLELVAGAAPGVAVVLPRAAWAAWSRAGAFRSDRSEVRGPAAMPL